MFRHVVGLLVSVLLVLGIPAAVLLWYVEQPLSITEAKVFKVTRGSNLKNVARQLASLDVLENPSALVVYARLFGDSHILAGEYQVTGQDSLKSLLIKLNSGDVVKYQINFPEGLTFADWLLRLQQKAGLLPEATLQALDLSALQLPTEHPEGWFFPDTYTFTASDDGVDILRTAHNRMKQVLSEEWQAREVGLPYETSYQALIMASIIEKETGSAGERKQIAGVFVRRLQKNMRLQTDPTVIYGLGDDYRGNLSRRHLREDTPYNTYTRKGLPPTPIAMPGRAAIHAALNPAAGDTLYFVAKGDGSHYFSASLEEHLDAVRRFQLNRAPGYRSAPATNSDKN